MSSPSPLARSSSRSALLQRAGCSSPALCCPALPRCLEKRIVVALSHQLSHSACAGAARTFTGGLAVAAGGSAQRRSALNRCCLRPRWRSTPVRAACSSHRTQAVANHRSGDWQIHERAAEPQAHGARQAADQPRRRCSKYGACSIYPRRCWLRLTNLFEQLLC